MRRSAIVAPLPFPADSAIEHASLFVQATLNVPVAVRVVVNTPATDEEQSSPRGRGRPKLGVVAREVTLLPRHWEWLNGQPGGASVVLRKLVDAARVAGEDKDRVRRAQEAVDRFMTAMAGNLPGYEEATRALYANDTVRFDAMIASWPADVRRHTQKLAALALEKTTV